MPTRSDMERFLKLLPFSQVRHVIESSMEGIYFEVETLSVVSALGRICSEEIRSENDIPPRPISAMDGYAIMSGETRNASGSAPARFMIRGALYPKDANARKSISGDDTYYIATGAPIPEGADAVVRVEQTRLTGNMISVSQHVPDSENVSFQGEDIRKSEILFSKGHILNAADIALLISAGKREIKAYKTPNVGIISIGDELIAFEDGDNSTSQKTINNYSNLIIGLLNNFGIRAETFGIAKDEMAEIRRMIEHALKKFDCIITIGGTSVGKKDFAPTAVGSVEGASMIFHGVRIVPIRPTGLALINGKPIFILPGHAVSATLAFFLTVIPVLNLLSGLSFDSRQAMIEAESIGELENDRAIDSIVLVQLKKMDRGFFATPLEWGSNLIHNLSKANGFVLLKAKEKIRKHDVLQVLLLGARELERIPSA
ncbi:MAG: molybdopterin molybdotransferase MoeA [Thaumarchaeota archaeon]|nr:molybdopterin molybdotransferase MoeA [Nitrososphaerota archaeon]